jgi:hypothetical protein
MVEFGLIALLFVLILFGIVDFGMLLNGWINVSTGSAAGARWAALGNSVGDTAGPPTVNGIYTQAKASSIVPGVNTNNVKVIVKYTSATGGFTATYFCRGFTQGTSPGGSTVSPIVGISPTDYDPVDAKGNKIKDSGAAVVCKGEPSGFNPPYGTIAPAILPDAGDSVNVTVIADQFEIVTPLVRPFFGCSTTGQHCYVPLTSSTNMRYEGSVA